MFNNNFEENQNVSGTPYRKKKMPEEDTNQDDSTKYGEFISSFFNWMTLDEQKKRANELNNMTKNNENNK